MRPRVVLVGAGHAHLHVVRHADVLRAAGVEPVLVAPSRFYYSGLATGVLSGAFSADRAEIDVAALAAQFGVEHLPAEVRGFDRTARRLRLSDGHDLPYDAVSFNVGSVTADPLSLTRGEDAWRTKPLSGLFDLRTRVESCCRAQNRSPAIIVAGGGQSGFEIAAALAGLLTKNGHPPSVQLICKSTPAWGPARAIAQLSDALRDRGVLIAPGQVAQRGNGVCRLSDGASLPCDLLVLATGLTAAPLIAATGLPVSPEGRLRVGRTLQSVADPAVFAVGDCSVLEGAPRPTAGVFGVRAAPILLQNLAALGTGAPMQRYPPQRHWLAIMDLGDGTGLATRGPLWWMGRGALALKRRLDLGFIERMRGPSGEPLQN